MALFFGSIKMFLKLILLFAIAPGVFAAPGKVQITKQCDLLEPIGGLIKSVSTVPIYKSPGKTKFADLKIDSDAVLLGCETHSIPEGNDFKYFYWLQIRLKDGQKGWIEGDEKSYAFPEYLKDEDAKEIAETWKRAQRYKVLDDEKLLEHLENGEYLNYSMFYYPRKVTKFIYPEYGFTALSFGGRNNASLYKVTNCRRLKELLHSKLSFKTLGERPYVVRFNNFFIETNFGPLSDNFSDMCELYTTDTSYQPDREEIFFDKITSKAGPLLTVEISTRAHPNASHFQTKTYDLRTGKEATIFEFFEKDNLLQNGLRDNKLYIGKNLNRVELSKDIANFITALSLKGFNIYDPGLLPNGKVKVQWISEFGVREGFDLELTPLPWFRDELKKIKASNELLLK